MIRCNVKFSKVTPICIAEFGKGDIEVAAAIGDDYSSLLMKSCDKRGIGETNNVKGKNSDWFKPEVVMTFTKVGSIDVVIDALEECKRILEEKEHGK